MIRRLLALAAATAIAATATPALATGTRHDGLLAYDVATKSGNLAIAVARPGHAPRLIPHLPAIAETPVWSPDGRWIAFSGGTWSACCQIYVVHPDGSGLRQLTHDPQGVFEPAWMPDGKQLLAEHAISNAPSTNGASDSVPTVGGYVSNNVDGQPLLGAIITIDVRTGAMKTVVQQDEELQYPTWSRGLNAVVFAAGTYATAPAPDSGIVFDNNGYPAFFGTMDADPSRIETVHLDGSGLQVLAVGITPSAAPDGKHISYSGITEFQGLAQVHVMNNDGSNDHVVSNFGWDGVNATWTPDGNGLLVTAGNNRYAYNGDAHIAHVNVSTGVTHDLTPAWSAFGDQQPA